MEHEYEDFKIDQGEFAGTVEFTGVMLADVSSHIPGKAYWTEIYLYLTVGGKYIAHIIGGTDVEGKRERHLIHSSESAREILRELSKNQVLSDLAYSVISEAAEDDDGYQVALSEYDSVRMKTIQID